MPKGPEKSSNCWHTAKQMTRKDFKRSCQLSQRFTLTPMTWKGQIWKRRIASVSIRQESLRRSSVTEQRREYSPEGNRVIPRERYVSYFVLKTSKILKESEEFYSYRVWIIYTGSELFIPDPKLSPNCSRLRNYLFMPNTNYSHHIRSPWRPMI